MNSYIECKEIVELDLDPIKVKLMHKESGEGWTLEQASVVEAEYRRFLYLAKIFPHELAAPSMDVDTFWHYHILDTMKYARDCEEVFGYFLHHFPYVGLRGEDDLVAHHDAGERMAELYEQTFGEKYRSILAEAWENGKILPSTLAGVRGQITAYSVNGATAYLARGTTAYSVKGPTELASTGMNQDETGFLTHSKGGAFSTDPATTITHRGIDMNTFFVTRPQLAAQANAA